MDEEEKWVFIDPKKINEEYKKEILSKCSINVHTGEWYCKGTNIYINIEIMKELIYN